MRFLISLTDAHEDMRHKAVVDYGDAAARREAIAEAFRTASSYQNRYEIALLGAQDVIDRAEECFDLLRDIRDVLMAGAAPNGADERYAPLRVEYGRSIRVLQSAMREHLDLAPVDLSGGS